VTSAGLKPRPSGPRTGHANKVDDAMTPLAGWENFYVIVGSSAGALIGLQFVVMTLIVNRPIAPGLAQAGSAFASPTIVHFGAVLLLSAAQCAPWHRSCIGVRGSRPGARFAVWRWRGGAPAALRRYS
jgi:hypothetical protein